jgi:hypothetical protein
MSRSCWRILIAALGITLGYPVDQASSNQNRATENQPEDAEHGPPSALPTIENSISTAASLVQAAQGDPKTYADEKRAERDVHAQESMAKWAFWMLVVAAITAGLSAVGMVLIWRQVSLTRRAVEETGAATNAMNRQNGIAAANLLAFKDVERGRLSVRILGADQNTPDGNTHIHGFMGNYGGSGVEIVNFVYDFLDLPQYPDAFEKKISSFVTLSAGYYQTSSALIRDECLEISDSTILGGYVEYRNNFNEIHRSYFCYKFKPGKMPNGSLGQGTHVAIDCRARYDWPKDT